MQNIYILGILVLLTSCGSEPLQVEYSRNGNEAAMIAEVDGCRIWKVTDGNARTIYFANCNGSAKTEWQTSNGKTTTRHESITVGAKQR